VHLEEKEEKRIRKENCLGNCVFRHNIVHKRRDQARGKGGGRTHRRRKNEERGDNSLGFRDDERPHLEKREKGERKRRGETELVLWCLCNLKIYVVFVKGRGGKKRRVG